ncbi:MAG: NAD(P)H-dependent oxidoreductase [Thermoleophilia bacterium]
MTERPFRVLGIAGSLRTGSLNRAVLRALAAAPPEGVEVQVYDRLGDVPMYNGDLDGADLPEAVVDLRARIGQADALLVVTPEYNSSVPGVLKNALDWASRPLGTGTLTAMPVGVAGVSPSMFGAVWAAAEVRKALTASGARVLETEVAVPKADTLIDDAGEFTDAGKLGQLAELLEELRELASVPVED